MRAGLIAAIALAMLTAMDGASHGTKADPYRWCADYDLSGDGGTNCYFLTREQCEAAISGVGGLCRPNPFYTGPAAGEGPPARRHQNRKIR